MIRKDIQALLIAANSTSNWERYPWGNKELNQKLKDLESINKIKFCIVYMKWAIKVVGA